MTDSNLSVSGTILNFKVIGSEDEMENFHFDGWYVNNNIVSRDSQIKVIAANDNNTTNEFVAKYSTWTICCNFINNADVLCKFSFNYNIFIIIF